MMVRDVCHHVEEVFLHCVGTDPSNVTQVVTVHLSQFPHFPASPFISKSKRNPKSILLWEKIPPVDFCGIHLSLSMLQYAS